MQNIIPTYEELLLPVLNALKDGKERKNKEIALLIQKLYGLSDEDMNVLIPSGSSKVLGNVNWAIIQAFVGALDGKHAKKGVFITTSSFTAQAVDYAKNTSARIILIDGRQLCRYMIQFNLGVVVKEQLLLKQLDQNYFMID